MSSNLFYPSAAIIGDSINSVTKERLVTFEVTYHRFLAAEFNTHRMLSKNASSSRAIPVKKQITRMLEENVEPIHWGAQQKGMQANVELDGWRRQVARLLWNSLRYINAAGAFALAEVGLHKQIANRVIEPYSTITMIVSATEWQNFFNLRAHKDAQPEFQALAYQMKELYDTHQPASVTPGTWHLPTKYDIGDTYPLRNRLRAAVGKIARVSYLTQDKQNDVGKDIELFNRLVGSIPRHSSPTEHVAFATHGECSGNFGSGWKQFRHIIEEHPNHWIGA